MGLLSRVKAAVLFGCMLTSFQSFAEDYWWSNGDGTHYTNPSDACSKDMGTDNGRPITFDRVQFTSEISGRCMYVFDTPPRTWIGSTQSVNRRGDSCSTGTGPFDPATGICTVPTTPPKQPGEKCDDQTGATSQNPYIYDGDAKKCIKFFDAGNQASCKYMAAGMGNSPISYTVAGNISSTGQAVAPPTFTGNSLNCQVQTVSTSDCTLNVAGAVSCNVTGTFTGEVNLQGTKDAADSLCPGGKCPPKEPQTESKEEACNPIGNGAGGSSCTQTKETTVDGSQQCGTVDGGYKCITKQPGSNGLSTTITATSETLPDGSVKVTTVKDSSNTVCTDVKTCTTKTSTTTTHSTTSPGGGTKTDTTCKGTCTANGGGVETVPNAGTGTGIGGGTGGNGNGEGDGSDGTASTSDDCAAPPPCDGDPFQCAILKQAHIDTCKLMADATAEQKSAANAKTDAAYGELDAHQAQLDSDVNGLLSKFQGQTSGGGGGGKCLPDFQFAVAGHTFQMEFSKACDSLSWVRLVVLACAYLFAARIVSREV